MSVSGCIYNIFENMKFSDIYVKLMDEHAHVFTEYWMKEKAMQLWIKYFSVNLKATCHYHDNMSLYFRCELTLFCIYTQYN